MGKLKITVDLECSRCSTKIQKVLCCIQEQCELVIEKVEYEKDKVTVSGPFDANKLSCSLWAKAGRIIKNIEVVKEKEPEPKAKPKPKPKCKLVYSCPYYPNPCPQPGPGAWPCSSCPTPHCGCHQSKPPLPKPPACQCPPWSSPWCYCGHGQPYMPPPSPPKPAHYCGSGGYQYQPCMPSPMPPPCPPPMPYPMVVCEDSPPTCAIM
ncbi:hypothetical protein BDA96_06G067000 [Sorghum bicolor]|uniref:HMA domain-containing protein n=3 Tax=Sorghum bicolor TaxID=4558 RepID=A0A921QRI3_SORBI|nr:hypothetical protein SORBI_3006G060400 [Sorghum bicolor]KAG0525561.1 hypothetical protein BDA96_06G067000 [Sorghum bicolor]KAG0525562.1 hypothetical protein BDA96_06G067000 [Sorghum bicolor]